MKLRSTVADLRQASQSTRVLCNARGRADLERRVRSRVCAGGLGWLVVVNYLGTLFALRPRDLTIRCLSLSSVRLFTGRTGPRVRVRGNSFHLFDLKSNTLVPSYHSHRSDHWCEACISSAVEWCNQGTRLAIQPQRSGFDRCRPWFRTMSNST